MRQFLIASALLCVHTAVFAADPLAPRAEDVTFQSGSITIAGTLSLPAGRGPFPAVVLLSGSGPHNRDSEMFGFRPFKLMADFFAARGIGVLRCDDRGSAARCSPPRWRWSRDRSRPRRVGPGRWWTSW